MKWRWTGDGPQEAVKAGARLWPPGEIPGAEINGADPSEGRDRHCPLMMAGLLRSKPTPMKTLGKLERTARGFEIIEFTDCSATPCSLQASSLAEYKQPGSSAVWLGCADAQPRVMAQQAAAVGVQTNETTGWVPYPIPEEVLLSTRAHLNRKQVQGLINHLSAWLKTGSFST